MFLVECQNILEAWDVEKKICGDTPEDVTRKITAFLKEGRENGTINSSKTSNMFRTFDPDDKEKEIYCSIIFYNKN